MLAPTGTIGFMMDCDTTGVEPDIALVKYKKLVGGGMMKIVNTTVPMALTKLGYTPQQVNEIIDYIDENETIEGAPHVKEPHLAVFDCAFKPARGAAVHPLHGPHQDDGRRRSRSCRARSRRRSTCRRTRRSRRSSRPTSIRGASARRPCRSIATAASGRSRSTRARTPCSKAGRLDARGRSGGRRSRRAASCRTSAQAITHKFDIAGHEGYITVGLFEDGKPGEIFLVMAKEGSTISGFADAFAQAICYALQYGVPLQDLVDKFSHVRFEPSGMTRNPDVRFAKSIVDYIFRWMAAKFLSPDAQFRAGVNNREEARPTTRSSSRCATADAGARRRQRTASAFAAIQNQEDAPPCSTCGSIMVRSGRATSARTAARRAVARNLLTRWHEPSGSSVVPGP